MVANALNGAWLAFKTRPWLLIAMQLPLLFLYLAVLLVPTLLVLFGDDNVPGLAVGVLIALAVIAYAVLRVGYDYLALKVVRGEEASAATVLSALRRTFGIVFAYVLIGLLAGAVLGALGLAFFISSLSLPHIVSLLLAILEPVGVWIVLIGGALFLLGIVPWPLVLMDHRRGALPALREAWALTEGHRLSLVSLFIALTTLGSLGIMSLGVGLIVTAPIAACARAAFYARLVAEQEGAVARAPVPPVTAETAVPVPPEYGGREPPRRRPYSRIVVDGWIALYGVVTGWLVILVATVAPIIDYVRDTWSPYGSAMLLGPILLAPIALLIVYLVVVRLLPWTPGARIVADGWGQFEWLAVPGAVGLALAIWRMLMVAASATVGITSMGVGNEMARQMVTDLPPGYVSRPSHGDSSDWFDAMKLASDDSENRVWANYTVTDTVGAPYFFAIERYYDKATAISVMGLLGGEDSQPLPSLGEDAIEDYDDATGLVRLAVRDGATVLAAEAGVDHAITLRGLIDDQLARLDMARAEVAPVYDRLPKPKQQPAGTSDQGN